MDIRVTKTIVEVYFMEAELQATAVCIQSSANRWWSWSICRRSTRGIWRTMQMISKLSSVRWTYDRKNGTVFFSNLERLRSRDTRPVQAWKSSVTLYMAGTVLKTPADGFSRLQPYPLFAILAVFWRMRRPCLTFHSQNSRKILIVIL